MRYRAIGQTTLRVSEIGFGCWTMGGPNYSPADGAPIGWADVNEEEILAGIKVGLDAGVNHWDNADVYGNGRAERMLAKCLHRLGIKRETQVIATKVGHVKGTSPHGLEPLHLRAQCEQSLRNLRTDFIDIYYCHHGTYTGLDCSNEQHDYLHESAAMMHMLKKEGKVRTIGQSAYSDDDFARAIPVLKPDVLQAQSNMRSGEFIRPGSPLQALMETHGCTFVGFGPLDQGVLLDKFDPENPPKFEQGDYRNNRKDFSAAALRGVRAKIDAMKRHFGIERMTGDELTGALSSLASRWVLAHAHVCSTIPGFRNVRQARANIRAATDEPMSAADVEFVSRLFASV